MIQLKKTKFWVIFDHFWLFLPKGDISQKNQTLSRTTPHGPLNHVKLQKQIMGQSQESFRTDPNS